jgi:mercuric ion transport protein
MNEKRLAIGSTIAALLASLCCLSPLLLGGAGLGALLAGAFAPLRPYFLAISLIFLAGAFYFVYRKPKSGEACVRETSRPEGSTHRMAKPLLWVEAVAVAVLAFFPSYGVKLVGRPAVRATVSFMALQTAELKISGMDCPVCSGVIQRKLLETPGVVEAEVGYSAGAATVEFDATRTNTEKLVAVVKDTGYQAVATRPRQP